MNYRLQTIKECDLVSIIKEIADGETVNLDAVMADIEWLIEQAEKYQRLSGKMLEQTIQKNHEALKRLADS